MLLISTIIEDFRLITRWSLQRNAPVHIAEEISPKKNKGNRRGHWPLSSGLHDLLALHDICAQATDPAPSTCSADLYLCAATISVCKPPSPRGHRRQSGTGPRATTSPLLRPASCRASCRIWETKTERREGHPAVLRTEGEGRDANVVEDSPVENCRANPAAVTTNAFQTSPTNLLPVATPRSPATRRCAKRNSQHQRATPALTSFLSGGRGRFVQQLDRSPRTLEHELLLAGRSQPRGQHRRLSVALSRTTLQRSPWRPQPRPTRRGPRIVGPVSVQTDVPISKVWSPLSRLPAVQNGGPEPWLMVLYADRHILLESQAQVNGAWSWLSWQTSGGAWGSC
jgi:hypothetical protein